ncbi:hypothetical protein [Cohnella thermotolerans]|uniref:hypothetical protein n=1 Tax=Cohnella thermotolerans TaxID=329858 RepID=UPI000415B321|nr:hypothetical protein [Cohnella thermotolerans]
MRQSGKEAKLQRAMKDGAPVERREALAMRAGAEFADEFEPDARTGSAYGRRHPPVGRG